MNRKQIALALGIMCFILTLTIVLQVRTTSNSNKVASQTFTSNDLRDQVLKWKERYDTAYSELQDSEKKLDQVRQTASENTDGSAEKEEEIKKIEFEIQRAEKMLSNPGFVNKAPKEKVDEERAKLEKYKLMLEKF